MLAKRLPAVLVVLATVTIVGIALHLTGRGAPVGGARFARSETQPLPALELREPERPSDDPNGAHSSPAERRPLDEGEGGAVVLRGRVVERDTREPVAGAEIEVQKTRNRFARGR